MECKNGTTKREYGIDESTYIVLECYFENTTRDTITLNFDNSTLRIDFNHDLNTYTQKAVPRPYNMDKIQMIPSGGLFKFSIGEEIFLGTKLYSEAKRDYTNDVIKILPTIRVVYEDKGKNLRIESCGVRNVILHE